jgi:hypothetical protein
MPENLNLIQKFQEIKVLIFIVDPKLHNIEEDPLETSSDSEGEC